MKTIKTLLPLVFLGMLASIFTDSALLFAASVALGSVSILIFLFVKK
jgi:hypothetical protein